MAVEDTAPEQKTQAGTHHPHKESQRVPNCEQNKPEQISESSPTSCN